jgi:SNF2 family DNA or RNA helicase
MPAIVYGELDPVSGKIVIFDINADEWDRKEIGVRLSTCTPAFEETEAGPLLVPCSWEVVTQLVHSFPDRHQFQWTPGPKLSAWLIEEIIRRSCQGELLGEKPYREPMPHQSAGAIAIGMNGRFLLADEPGAGKTAAALMGLAELAVRNRNPWPALVVCPASVIDPWIEETALVYPDWNIRAYRGPKRKSLLKLHPRENLILAMSYETMRNDMGDASTKPDLVKLRPGTVIFDEAHKLCNYDTKQSVRARRLAKHIDNVIGATGTPITRHAGNFWPVLNAMYPDSYPSKDRYNSRYTNSNPYANDGHGEIGGLNPLREPEFRDVMRGTMRRVAKADVLHDLPPKTYQTRWLDIPPKWRKAYDEMEEDMLAHLPDSETMTPLQAMSALAKMTRLRQLANSACDVEVIELNEWDDLAGEFKTEVRVHPKEPCWKGDALLEILEELHQDDEGHGIEHGHRPVIAFSPYKKLTMLAGGMAEREGYKTGYIVGGMGDKQRTEVRLAFQAGKLDLICVTTGAGGTGLTLTAADTVVFLARPWSYVEALQAEDRAHRRGQRKHVQIIDLETRNSVESRVRAALRDKAHNLAELVQDKRLVTEFLGGK